MSIKDRLKKGSPFIIASLLVILLTFSFSSFMNIFSFRNSYANSYISSLSVSALDQVRKIEYAIAYGKNLENFYRIQDILLEIQNQFSVDDVIVLDAKGNPLYSILNEEVDRSFSQEIYPRAVRGMDSLKEDKQYESFSKSGFYYVFYPIENRKNIREGSLLVKFSQSIVNKETNFYITSNIKNSIILSVIAIITIIFFFTVVPFVNSDGTIRKKVLLGMILFSIGATQLGGGVIDYLLFQRGYEQIALERARLTAAGIKKDITTVVEKGASFSKIKSIKEWLDQIKITVPEIENIVVSDEKGIVRHSTENYNQISLSQSESENKTALVSEEGSNDFFLTVNISIEYINNKLRDIVLDSLTLILTTLFFTIEVTLFVIIYILGIHQNKVVAVENRESKPLDVNLIRFLSFLFFMCFAISFSFIALRMKELYTPIPGIEEKVILGLPISMEMLFAAIATLSAGFFIERRGWRPIFLWGVAFFAIGTFLSGYFTYSLAFALARGVAGIGYGLCLISMVSFVVTYTSNSEQRTFGIASHNAGLYAGINCGVVIGGMTAERIGYQNTFYIEFVISILIGIFALLIFPNILPKKKEDSEQADTKKEMGMFSYIFQWKVLSFFLFLIIPISMSGMFLIYYFPLFAKELNVSSSNISRAFLINGLLIAYIGPLLTSILNKHFKASYLLIFSYIILIAGLVVFAIYGSLLAAFMTVILIGLSESFGLAMQNKYILGFEATKQFGSSKAISLYNLVRKIGQVLGPMIFAMFLILGPQKGIGLIAALFSGMLLLYIASSVLLKRRQAV
jgi:predicted MFS family arabinose efflux permease